MARRKYTASSREVAHRRLRSLELLLHDLAFKRWLWRCEAQGSVLEAEKPKLASLETLVDADKVAWQLHLDAEEGRLPETLIKILDDYATWQDHDQDTEQIRRARARTGVPELGLGHLTRLTENLVRIAWSVVLGMQSPTNAVDVAKGLGPETGGANVVAVRKALEKHTKLEFLKVRAVYFALASGSPARHQNASHKTFRKGDPLLPIVTKIGKEVRAAKGQGDIPAVGNVTAVRAPSGSECPTPVSLGVKRRASVRRVSSKRK